MKMEIEYIISKILRKVLNCPAIKESTISPLARIDYGSIVVKSSMSDYSYIGEHTSVLFAKIGKYTSISNYCAIGGGNHPVNWVSMSPVFNSSKGIIKKKFSNNEFAPFQQIIIGNDVWIGSHCLIKSGTKISDGAVIGMGSVVTKDVGPYEIWAGNPARLIKKRFDDETIYKLEHIHWWDLPEEMIKKYADYFNDVNKFLNILEG